MQSYFLALRETLHVALKRQSGRASQQYRQRMSTVAPSRYLQCVRNVDVVFQFAENAVYVSREQASAFIDSAPADKAPEMSCAQTTPHKDIADLTLGLARRDA